MAAQMSTCMKIVNSMSEADQDALLTRLDQYFNDGVPAEQAQLMAANDYMEELLAEQAEFRTLLQEQHPDLFRAEAEPMASAPRDPVVDTPAFRRWFGDSKVVDADGNPLVVYHGTNQSITAFDPARIGSRDAGFFGTGFYLTPDEDAALDYADTAVEDTGEGEATAMPIYASLQNPFIWDMSDEGAGATRAALASFGIKRDSVRGNSAALSNAKEREVFNRAVRAAGFDGVIVRDEDGVQEIVAFKPTQLKSATGNSGAFDPVNPDIRASAPRSPQVDTPEFKRWSDGLPVHESFEDRASDRGIYKLFHMTTADFTEFKPGGLNPKDSGPAIFLSTNPAATSAAFRVGTEERGFREGARTMPVYAKIKNPLVIDDKSMLEFARAAFANGSREFPQLMSQETVDALKADGYDSIIFDGPGVGWSGAANEIIVFEPTQIKSVFNRGQFDPTNPDIRASAPRSPSKIFGQDIAPLAIRAYRSLPVGAKSIIDGWNVNWSMGQGRLRDNEDWDAVVAAYEPVREKLREIYGDTIPAFRGEKQDGTESDGERFLFSWTPMRGIATSFAVNRIGGMPSEITQAQVDQQVENYRRTGIARLNGYKFVRRDPGDFEPDGPDYYYIYRGREMITDGDDIAEALQQEKDERDEWRATLRESGKVYTADIPVDSIAFVPVGANLRQPELVAEYNPRQQEAQEISFSAPRTPLGFYSELAEQIEKGPGQAPKDQWKAYIKGLQGKGVKADEIEWTGINDWLDLQEGKVKKSDVMEYLNNNGVQVEEVTLGVADYFGSPDEAINYLAERYSMTPEDVREEYGYTNDRDYIALARSVVDDRGDQSKYGKYQLPGGENYREVLLTLPEQKGGIEDWYRTVFVPETKREDPGYEPPATFAGYDAEAKESLSRMYQEWAGKNKRPAYMSSHWDQTNVLAHIRLNDRTDADGNRVLFVEEVQSDWGQEGKKKGFAAPKLTAAEKARIDEIAVKARRGEATTAELAEAAELRQKSARAIASIPTAPFVTKTDGWLNLALKRIMVMAAEGGYDKVAFVNGQQSADRYDLSRQVDEIRYRERDGMLVAAKDGDVVKEVEASPKELPDLIGKEAADRLLNKPTRTTDNGYKILSGVDLKVGGEGMKTFYDTIVPNAVKALLKKLGGGQVEMVAVGTGWESGGWAGNKKMAATQQPGFTVTDAMREKVAAGVPMFSAPRRPQTQTPEFRRWFGDSKVVDANGQPLVVYHGTAGDITFFDKLALGESTRAQSARSGFFFAASPKVASGYAMLSETRPALRNAVLRNAAKSDVLPEDLRQMLLEASEQFSQQDMRDSTWINEAGGGVSGANVLPVYLSIQNPMVVDYGGKTYRERKFADVIAEAKDAGHDGVLFRNAEDSAHKEYSEVTDIFVAFEPTQIKSATGNSGAFSGTDRDIRASVARQPLMGQRFTLPGEGRWMATRRKLQDQFIRVREVQRAIVEGGGVVGEAQDVYEAELRSYGRIQEQMKDFSKRWVEPMVEKAGKAKVTLDEVALYAYAKHATERNRNIARKNQTLPDGGSGMTDQEAQDILDAFDQEGKTAALDDLHRDLMAITSTTRRVLLDEGLITQDEYDALEDQYDMYVPLRGFERVTDEGEKVPRRGAGRGFNVRGAETMRALGRTSRAGDIIENIVSDYERAIVRAERNNVAKAFLDLVMTNPDPDLWEIDAVRTTRSLNRQTGQVQFNRLTDKGKDTISVKLAGKEVFVKVRDPLLLRALRQAAKDETGAVGMFLNNTLGIYTNWMRNVLTRYNPAFSAVNAVRDYQAGNVAVLDKLGGEGVKLYNKYYLASMASSFRNERGSLDQAAREMDRWFEEFRAAGGTTGGFFMRDAEEIRKDLRQVLVAAGAAPANKLEAIQGSKPYAGAKALLHWLEIAGSTSENAARVAAYRAAREMGKSPAEAASIAKNLTTNFNRKGEWGHVMNSLYLFFNAAVQGTHRVGQAMKNPKVQALMAGVTATAMGLAFLGADVGGEDEDGEKYWDQIPDFEKERNLIIMLPPGLEMDGTTKVGTNGRYIKIPLPYGFNVFPATGYALADLIRNVQNPNHGATLGKAAIRTTSALFGAYNPMGGAFDPTDPVKLGMAVAPTAADLAIQLAAGVNPFGDPVGQFKSPYDPRPDSEIAGPREAGTVSQRLARWMNEATGGNSARSGGVDVQPATINNLARTFGGGTGDFLWSTLVNLPSKALTPEAEVMLRDIPIAKAFGGAINKDSDMRKFYERRGEVLKEYNAAKGEMEQGIVVEYDAEDRALQALGGAADKYTKAMSTIRKEEVRIADDDRMTDGEKAIKRKELEKLRVEMARQFNSLYSTTMRGAKSSQ